VQDKTPLLLGALASGERPPIHENSAPSKRQTERLSDAAVPLKHLQRP
jgi:hypothetical protein